MILVFSKPIKFNFKSDFFQYQKVYPFYSKILNKTNLKYFQFNNSNLLTDFVDKIFLISNIPPYFDLALSKDHKSLVAIEILQFEGFLVNLKKFQSIENYIGYQFGAKSRSKIRSYKRRLEKCFNIRYQLFFGEITREEYNFLFKIFRLLIEKRFEQRGDTHESLRNWDAIKKETFNMILDNKASLFVIYDNEKPIDICLNYHFQNIFINYIRSYDIDYSKFKLGDIDLLKQLAWCFANNYEIFDLGRGDFEYKRRWCNETYKFKYHIIYSKNHQKIRILAFFISKFILVKAFLKEKDIHLYYKKIKSIYKNRKIQIVKKPHVFSTENINSKMNANNDLEELKEVSLEQYPFLRKPTYDFQYLNFENSDNITVYKCIKRRNSYLIKGKVKNQLITLSSEDY